jgi:hypothetical protein
MTRIIALVGLAWLTLILGAALAWATWRNRERARHDL